MSDSHKRQFRLVGEDLVKSVLQPLLRERMIPVPADGETWQGTLGIEVVRRGDEIHLRFISPSAIRGRQATALLVELGKIDDLFPNIDDFLKGP